MTNEEKQLLLKDICTRIPYGLLCQTDDGKGKLISVECSTGEDLVYVDFGHQQAEEYDLNEGDVVMPYLRPLSSMTEKEKKDILQSLNIHGDIDNEGNLLLGVECNMITLKVCKKYLGELNKRMFDVCRMIEKGLALDAPEGMYN